MIAAYVNMYTLMVGFSCSVQLFLKIFLFRNRFTKAVCALTRNRCWAFLDEQFISGRPRRHRSSITNRCRDGQSVYLFEMLINIRTFKKLKRNWNHWVLAVIACVFRFGYPPKCGERRIFFLLLSSTTTQSFQWRSFVHRPCS